MFCQGDWDYGWCGCGWRGGCRQGCEGCCQWFWFRWEKVVAGGSPAADVIGVGGERTDDGIGLAQFHLDLSGGMGTGLQQVFDLPEGGQPGGGVHGFGAGGIEIAGAVFSGQWAQAHDAAKAGIQGALRPPAGRFPNASARACQ